MTSLSYVIITIYLPNILNCLVSFLVKRVLHSQILVLSVPGVGCAMVTVSLIVCIYYNVIMSYTVYYMVSSFASEVPWSKCDPTWADMSTCYVRGSRAVSNTQLMLDLNTDFFKWLRHHVASVYLTYCLSVMYDLQVLQRTGSPHCCRISYVTGASCPISLLLFDLVTLMIFSEDNKPKSYSLCSFFPSFRCFFPVRPKCHPRHNVCKHL